MAVHVFVYGTLKEGFPNNYLIKDPACGKAKLLCKGSTSSKYPLIVATKFHIPFLLDEEGQGEFVQGEIYEVDEKMLKHLDELERHPMLYVRTRINITPSSDHMKAGKVPGSDIKCGTYLLSNYKKALLELPFLTCYSDASNYVSPRDAERKLADLVAILKN